MKNKRIVCLYGGPGSGKSTTCAGLFYNMKLLGFDVEMNREYVKEWVWEGRSIQEGDQPYFFSKMARRERIYMKNDVDYIVTDSPLVLTHYYGLKYDPMEREFNTSLMMLKNHHQICKNMGYKVEHYFITRSKTYNPNGRYQTEDEARQIDYEIREMLERLGIRYQLIDYKDAVNDILQDLGANEGKNDQETN